MGRFGIGARVRDLEGDEGVITDKEKGRRLLRYDDAVWGSVWRPKSELTPTSTTELQIGDRVQFVEKYGGANAGDEGVITYFWPADDDPKGGVAVEVNGRTYTCFVRRVERVPAEPTPAVAPATEWVPKVGDRVRFKVDNPNGGAAYGEAGQEAVVHRVYDRESSVYGRQVEIEDPGCGFLPNAPVSALEPLLSVADELTPAPITIEAGKFYRTRDGRKVGPMVRRTIDQFGHPYGGDFIWTDNGSDDADHTWQADGYQFYTGDSDTNDLVAEWVDEPVAEPATTDEVAKPKFKKGDRVRPVAEQRGWVTSHWDKHWKDSQGPAHGGEFYVVGEDSGIGVVISAKPNGNGPFWPSAYLEPVTPAPAPATTPTESFIVARLTSAGYPRPNARPRVHYTLDSATAEAQRLADRLGDEFAVYQRVDSRTVDAGPVPEGRLDEIRQALSGERRIVSAFGWSSTKQGWDFWNAQNTTGPTPLGLAILRKWIAEAEAKVAA